MQPVGQIKEGVTSDVVPRWDTYDRSTRAKVIDNRIQQGIVELAEDMAEMIVNRLYLELKNHETGELFSSAREYFSSRQISKTQGYRLVYLGLEVMPKLVDSKLKEEMLRLGQGKLEIISKKADFDSLLAKGSLKIGDEEFDLSDLEEMKRDDLDARLKSLSKKVEKNDLLEEQNKSLQLEKKVLLKEQEEFKKRDQKYREASVTYDEMERDIVDATEAFAEVQKLLNRIETSLVPKQLGPRLKLLIETIQNAGVDIAEIHSEVMFKYDEGL